MAKRHPSDMSLLRLQDTHTIETILEGTERLVCPRRHVIWVIKNVEFLHPRVKNMINVVEFDYLLAFSNFHINHHLVTALIKR